MKPFAIWFVIFLITCLLWQFVLPESIKIAPLQIMLSLILGLSFGELVSAKLRNTRDRREHEALITNLNVEQQRVLARFNEQMVSLVKIDSAVRRGGGKQSLDLFSLQTDACKQVIGEALTLGVSREYLRWRLKKRGFLFLSPVG